MTAETWFAFVATSILLAALPSPLACLTAGYALQRGRLTAIATIPGVSLGLTTAFLIAAVPLGLIAIALPRVMDVLSWVGAAYLMLYVLWSFQDPKIVGPIADNDNLPEKRLARVFACLFGKSVFGPRYIILFSVLLAQFLDPSQPVIPQALQMQAAFLACAALGATIHVLFPRRTLNRMRRPARFSPASRKLQTQFISRRAVSAGYRRIAA
ncbi:LysE family translocator [Rhizobium sp. LCM 4573]|uniref:LysE family translocator n=1 Tax=Rhizobium sp. LCM 4573 TaxID=1848291 RepID=UPI0008D9E270|nr:LysE family translocator [Rhizobium sp. LCM 4573]OHV84212.1 hypothetical protein LCM4573_00445 [Rhizobium sp. LCM 4573]